MYLAMRGGNPSFLFIYLTYWSYICKRISLLYCIHEEVIPHFLFILDINALISSIVLVD